MRKNTSPEALNPEAVKNDRARFPGQIADTIALPEPLDAEHLDIEGLPLQVIETGHTDTVDTTSLHVPDLGLIVSGDVAYNHCHMYVGPTTADIRAEWIAALDRLAALNPAAVVTVTRIRSAAIHPRFWPSPGGTSNTTDSYVRQACPIRSCSTPW
jgi:glyoxylase-like metal-dependent hydrolase (beta-lactamase superfamily II)